MSLPKLLDLFMRCMSLARHPSIGSVKRTFTILYFALTYLQDALRTFLLRKLDNLAKDDKCQITMISTWATELYLDKVLLLFMLGPWME